MLNLKLKPKTLSRQMPLDTHSAFSHSNNKSCAVETLLSFCNKLHSIIYHNNMSCAIGIQVPHVVPWTHCATSYDFL